MTAWSDSRVITWPIAPGGALPERAVARRLDRRQLAFPEDLASG